ncbi:MAG TPA: Mbeg1-like protein [Kofleriaceae bacterium]|jgi:phospholipase/carboxylesterase
MIAVGDPDAPIAAVVLHGREMCGADLAPFAAALAKDAYWIFPDAPLVAGRARAWWPIDPELSAMDPPGRAEARAYLDAILATLHQPFVLAGFSQGGMLAMDYVLHGGRRPAALALLSSTRIAIDDWTSCAQTGVLTNLPVLVAHGTGDAELAFTAGEQLRDFATAHGAAVQWLAFDGGHQLPFVVWRALRKLVASMR